MQANFLPTTRRGPARTILGASASEDREARDALRWFYADVLDTLHEAELHAEDATFALDWITTETAEACDVSPARAGAAVRRALVMVERLRGAPSRARRIVRELLGSIGVVTFDTDRRVVATITDQRLRRILETPSPRRDRVNPGAAFVVAHGPGWKATLYRVRAARRKVAMARLRVGRSILRSKDVRPDFTLPDGRTACAAVRDWKRHATRSNAERLLAGLFLRRRA